MDTSAPLTYLPHPVQRAHTRMVAALQGLKPHRIRYEADKADLEERKDHIQAVRNAVDAYCAKVIDDTANVAPVTIESKYLNGLASDATAEIVGALANAAEDLAEAQEWDR